MPDLPATEFTAVVSGDGALVPPDDVRAALVPGARVRVRLAGDAPRLFPPTTLDEIGSVLGYDGPTIPVEKMGIEAIDYRDLYPDGP